MSAPYTLPAEIMQQLRTTSLPERIFCRMGLYGLADRALRSRMNYLQSRAYIDAASNSRIYGDRKRTSASAHAVWQADATKVRHSFLYLHDSDPYCRSAMTVMTDNVVGTGIRTQKQVEYRPLPTGPDAGQSDAADLNYRTNNFVEQQKARWCEQADYRGKQHWYEMQAAIFRQLAGEGEALLVERFDADPARLLPLCYEHIDLSRLTSRRPMNVPSGHEVMDGLELDSRGRVVAYHFEVGTYAYRTERFDASQVHHHFRQDRAEQLRGISWFAPVIPDLYGLREIKEYSIIARKVQAAIALVVTNAPGGGALPPGVNSRAISQGSGDTAHTAEHRSIEPGMIHRVPHGASVHSHAPSPSADLDPLTRMHLRGIGIGLGMSYEFMAGDYSAVNFAGGKLSGQNFKRRAGCMHANFVRGIEAPVDRRWTDVAMSVGVIPRPRAAADPYRASYTHPSWEYDVNPLQSVNAIAGRLALGLTSLQAEISDRGGDFDETMRQIVAEGGAGQRFGLLIHQALMAAHQPEPDTPTD